MPTKTLNILFLADVPQHAASSQLIFEESDGKAYKQCIHVPEGLNLVLAEDFSNPQIEDGSIAYHPVFGEVYYRQRWTFSTYNFIEDLQAADENPAIAAHLIHVNSRGGEGFGCHEAFLAVKNLKKPVYALVDAIAASAGYYLIAAAKKIYASSIFSEIGSIGVMCTAYDWSEALKQEGIVKRDYYSNYSPLKNKVSNDAVAGNGDEFVRRFLDPMAYQFIDDVKSVRGDIQESAQQGDIFYAPEAMAAGLIDGQNTLEEVLEIIHKDLKPSPSVNINNLNF